MAFSFSDRTCLAQGTVHQGELPGGGVQCTCIAMAFICLQSSGSLQNILNLPSTVDGIIRDGTDIYTTHAAQHTLHSIEGKKPASYLMINELPELVELRGKTYTVSRQEPVYTGLLGTVSSEISSLTYSLIDAFDEVFRVTKTCFMTLGPPMSAYTSAVCKVDNNYICLDSHSRTREGVLSITGKAVIIESKSLTSFVSYINDLASSIFSSSAATQFELVPVICEVKTLISCNDNLDTIIKKVSNKQFLFILNLSN